jgi:hypothetical protein
VVLAAVQQKGWALEYASEELRGDREVVLAAVQRNGGDAVQRNGWDAVHHTKVQKLEHEREQSAASSSGNAASRIERLKELKNLRDLDLITEDVYKQKPTEILQSL